MVFAGIVLWGSIDMSPLPEPKLLCVGYFHADRKTTIGKGGVPDVCNIALPQCAPVCGDDPTPAACLPFVLGGSKQISKAQSSSEPNTSTARTAALAVYFSFTTLVQCVSHCWLCFVINASIDATRAAPFSVGPASSSAHMHGRTRRIYPASYHRTFFREYRTLLDVIIREFGSFTPTHPDPLERDTCS